MAENISLSDIIPAPPARVFEAWLDAGEHGRMTGSTATDEGGGRFTAWDGYISGRTVASEPHSRIEQQWRTTEFPEGAADSTLVVRFEAEGEGTKVTIEHSGIPDGQGDSYREGWKEYYFDPMKKHFGSPLEKVREAGEHVLEAGEQVLEDAIEAVDTARANARRQAVKTIQAAKKVQKKAAAKLKAVGKQVRQRVKALVSGKKKPKPAAKAARKPVARKKAPAARKPTAKKPAPKKRR